MRRHAVTLLLVAALAGCGTGDGPSAAIEDTRAAWQVLDLETGTVRQAATLADAAGAAYQDRFIAFRLVRPGTVAIGAGIFARQDDELAVAAMAVEPVYLAVCELTRAQWRRLAGNEPWQGLPGATAGGDDLPALGLAADAVGTALAGWNAVHGHHLALPTAVQWEAAARAGSAASFPWGEAHDAGTIAAYAVTWETGVRTGAVAPRPVGGRLANAWGFHDLCGNAWELVADGSARGGSWADALSLARPANRLDLDPAAALPTVGVRLAYRP